MMMRSPSCRTERVEVLNIASSMPHRVLNLPLHATVQQIKARYKQLALQHHPDLGGCKERFVKIQAAHDQMLKERGAASQQTGSSSASPWSDYAASASSSHWQRRYPQQDSSRWRRWRQAAEEERAEEEKERQEWERMRQQWRAEHEDDFGKGADHEASKQRKLEYLKKVVTWMGIGLALKIAIFISFGQLRQSPSVVAAFNSVSGGDHMSGRTILLRHERRRAQQQEQQVRSSSSSK